jgi:pyrroline-5-carboxylate reductase
MHGNRRQRVVCIHENLYSTHPIIADLAAHEKLKFRTTITKAKWRPNQLKNMRKVAVIGAGKMGEAIISGLLKSGAFGPKDIQAVEIAESRRQYITQTYPIKCTGNTRKAVTFGDIIILAVKPGVMGRVLEQVAPALKPEKIVISIAAGITLDFLRKHLPKDVPLIRVMPNIAVGVREGMIAVCPSENTIEAEVNAATDVLGLIGKTMRLDEKHLNLATGLVGSGPAYIYLIIDALADAGVRLGLPKDISTVLAAQTTLGAAKMVVETGEHPVKLKDMVATPAGTTVEGLLELEQGRLRAVIISAVTKAAERAKALQPT